MSQALNTKKIDLELINGEDPSISTNVTAGNDIKRLFQDEPFHSSTVQGSTLTEEERNLQHLRYIEAQRRISPPGYSRNANSNRNQDVCSSPLVQAICREFTQWCWNFNHPQCNITIPAPHNLRYCGVVVDCFVDLSEYSGSSLCFALFNAFQPPKYGEPDLTQLIYGYLIKGYNANDHYVGGSEGTGNQVHVSNQVMQFFEANKAAMAKFRLQSVHECENFKACRLAPVSTDAVGNGTTRASVPSTSTAS